MNYKHISADNVNPTPDSEKVDNYDGNNEQVVVWKSACYHMTSQNAPVLLRWGTHPRLHFLNYTAIPSSKMKALQEVLFLNYSNNTNPKDFSGTVSV